MDCHKAHNVQNQQNDVDRMLNENIVDGMDNNVEIEP